MICLNPLNSRLELSMYSTNFPSPSRYHFPRDIKSTVKQGFTYHQSNYWVMCHEFNVPKCWNPIIYPIRFPCHCTFLKNRKGTTRSITYSKHNNWQCHLKNFPFETGSETRMPSIILFIQDCTASPRCNALVIKAIRIEKRKKAYCYSHTIWPQIFKILENTKESKIRLLDTRTINFFNQLFLYNSNKEKF